MWYLPLILLTTTSQSIPQKGLCCLPLLPFFFFCDCLLDSNGWCWNSLSRHLSLSSLLQTHQHSLSLSPMLLISPHHLNLSAGPCSFLKPRLCVFAATKPQSVCSSMKGFISWLRPGWIVPPLLLNEAGCEAVNTYCWGGCSWSHHTAWKENIPKLTPRKKNRAGVS